STTPVGQPPQSTTAPASRRNENHSLAAGRRAAYASGMRRHLSIPLVLIVAPAVIAGAPGRYLHKPDAWFAGDDGRRVAANILSYQADLGGWPKNVDTTAAPYAGD